MAQSHLLADAALSVTKTLPNGAATANSPSIDLGSALAAQGGRLAPCELLLSAPAMGATPMPDAKTMKYKITAGTDNSTFGTTIFTDLIIQTGAGGVGCAAATARLKIPSDCPRYLRCEATGSAAGDASALSLTLQLMV